MVCLPAQRDGVGKPSADLRVGGLTPFTNIDFPGHLSAVVFVQGCPWRCGYCHNPHLQSRDGDSDMTWGDVRAFLERRAGLLDAVVFSGGEPTTDPALAGAIRDVRALGFRIGLHSAGMYPRRLAEVIPLVDWVGLDVKAPLDNAERHDAVTGVIGGGTKVRESVQVVLGSDAAHEFRTTVHPTLLGDEDLLAVGRWLASMGARALAVQVARPVQASAVVLPVVGLQYPAKKTLDALAALFPTFTVRRESIEA
jgi:pyruvate formate lyase activating enzyme